eukprot:TRINITY_DN55805_c0_g1_i1.p1 TRINITY_DN55805_c0_g1~~TRINITY_DN55805_c0_g1_i1.p1  ORF type:complete len:550 (+),score=88.42 TRINITY_DN55805_c0_g1_i1:152-1651(+)
MPTEVKRQRASMKWPWKNGVTCVAAFCSIPSLGLDNEEIVVSFEQPGADGSQRLLIQSLQRPELGLTILRLEAGGSQLSGGDEDWSPGEPPIIRASRGTPTSPKAAASPAKKAEVSVGDARAARQARQAQASRVSGGRKARILDTDQHEQGNDNSNIKDSKEVFSPSRRPSPTRKLYPDPFSDQPESDVEAEERRAVVAASVALPKAPIEGGIGRSGMQHSAPAAARQQGPSDPALPRPDVAANMSQQSSAVSDEQLRAGEAESIERLVGAASNGETGDLRLLVARIGPDHLSPPGSKHAGLTSVMVAAGRGRDEALEFLIEKKADLEIVDPRGWTALMHAISDQRPASVKRLLQARASVGVASAMDGGVTPLMLAANGPRPEICVALLENRAATVATDSDSRQAIHYAARAGRPGALALLLEARATVDSADASGLTPLLTAASAGRDNCVKMLLAARANAETKDADERSAADIAGAFNFVRVLAALTEHANERRGRRR